MAGSEPRVIIRLGSHAEKEYVEKTIRFLDGLVVGANLVEATPGATASLLVKCGGKKLQVPLFIDPMTYAFGAYIDPESGEVRHDLDWIKSEQKAKGQDKPKRAFKRSYRALGEALGDPFEAALKRGKSVGIQDFGDDSTCKDICKRIVEYQLGRIKDEFASDAEYAAAILDKLPTPNAVYRHRFAMVTLAKPVSIMWAR